MIIIFDNYKDDVGSVDAITKKRKEKWKGNENVNGKEKRRKWNERELRDEKKERRQMKRKGESTWK